MPLLAGYSLALTRHRPVDVKTGPDGALYISDDRGGTLFRLTYRKP